MVTNDSTVDDTFAEFLNFGAGVLSWSSSAAR